MSTVAIPHDIEPHPMTGMYNGKFGVWLFLASEVMLFGALFSTYILLRVGALDGTWPMFGAERPQGDQVLNVGLAALNTVILIASSVTMVLAWASLKMNNLAKGRLFLIITFTLAGTFLVVKYIEYSSKFHHQLVVFNNPITIDGKEVTHLTGHIEGEAEDFINFSPDSEAGSHHAEDIRIDRAQIKRLHNWGPGASTFIDIYFVLTGLHGLHIIGGMIVILYLFFTAGGMWKGQSDKFTNRVECTGLYWHFVDLVWIFLFPVLYLL